MPLVPGGSAGKESPCNAGDLGSIPGWEEYTGEGNGYPLQYSGLESPWGCKESDTTESLSHFESYVDYVPCIFHDHLKGMCILQEFSVIVLKYQLGHFVDSVA